MKLYFIVLCLMKVSNGINFRSIKKCPYEQKYGSFSEEERLLMKEEAKKMFYHGYDSYMKYAFPRDELNPIYCTGRGPDYDNPSNININDILGDYSLTLVDVLDTLAIVGNATEFKRAVQLVIDNVSFDKPNTIQVFEATIRLLGALLSAHLLIVDKRRPFGDLSPPNYDGELLHFAHDLASRLMPAFDDTPTGIPHPRVNLRGGVPANGTKETCTAAAGTMLLEFGILSHLLNDPVYESRARRSIEALWRYRSNVTGLVGNEINLVTGEWVGTMSGIGAGLDSFYEYLYKSYILFGYDKDLKMFTDIYDTIKFHTRKGRKNCNRGNGNHPLYVNVNMKTGDTVTHWMDALQAAWPGVQVIYGDIEEAICVHALFYTVWRKYGVLPERYNWMLRQPDVSFYPLRPELIESTYLLYQATKNPFYLHVGRDILHSLNNHTRTKCGYATVHDVNTMELEDRMESFFLSETCKYLFLLFDRDNHINKHELDYIFTTEGHVLPILSQFRQRDDLFSFESKDVVVDATSDNSTYNNCDRISTERQYMLPIKAQYLQQLERAVGLIDD